MVHMQLKKLALKQKQLGLDIQRLSSSRSTFGQLKRTLRAFRVTCERRAIRLIKRGIFVAAEPYDLPASD